MSGVPGGFVWWFMHSEVFGGCLWTLRNGMCPDGLWHCCLCLTGRWFGGTGLKQDEFSWLEGDDAQNFRSSLKPISWAAVAKSFQLNDFWGGAAWRLWVYCENHYPYLSGYKKGVFVQIGTKIILWMIKPWCCFSCQCSVTAKFFLYPKESTCFQLSKWSAAVRAVLSRWWLCSGIDCPFWCLFLELETWRLRFFSHSGGKFLLFQLNAVKGRGVSCDTHIPRGCEVQDEFPSCCNPC